jgi:hypothetical protein
MTDITHLILTVVLAAVLLALEVYGLGMVGETHIVARP